MSNLNTDRFPSVTTANPSATLNCLLGANNHDTWIRFWSIQGVTSSKALFSVVGHARFDPWKCWVACRLWAASQKRPRTVDFLAVGHWRHNPVYKVTCRPHMHFTCTRSRVYFCSYILSILLFIHSIHTFYPYQPLSKNLNFQKYSVHQNEAGTMNLHHWSCPLYADNANHYMSKLDCRFYSKSSTFKENLFDFTPY